MNSKEIESRHQWDDYFLSLAFVISQRSLDQNTKHGAIFISENNTILATGYNSPPAGSNDFYVPLTSPEKYDYFSHAEENAIISAARHGISLKNSKLYVTGKPCERCTRMILSTGVKEVIYGSIKSKCIDDKSEQIINNLILLKNERVLFRELNCIDNIKNILNDTVKYIDRKNSI